MERTLLLSDDDPLERFLTSAAGSLVSGTPSEPPIQGKLADVKKELMQRHIRQRLAAHGGDRKQLAMELGMHPNNLYRLLREHGL